METRRCPLCWVKAEYGVIEHLRRDHLRSEVEALVLLERTDEGSPGWNGGRQEKGNLFTYASGQANLD